MKWMPGCMAAALAAVLAGSPASAQDRSCADGRGGLMTDLGFDMPRRSVQIENGRPELRFEAEPTIGVVRADGPASGRLLEGDVLVAVDGEAFTGAGAGRRFSEIRARERVRLTVRRGDAIHEVAIVATERCILHPPAAPHAPDAPAAPDAPLPPDDELLPEGWLGFAIRCERCGDDDSGAFRFGSAPLVTAVEPRSPAASAGVRAGDRLTHVDGIALTSADGWHRFSGIEPGQSVRLTFSRGADTHQVTISARRRS